MGDRKNTAAVHALGADEALKLLGADPQHGLNEREAEERIAHYGRNVIEEHTRIRPLVILLNQFKGPFVILLAVAAGFSFWFQEWLDGIAIACVILINTLIGFFMEFKAERSMESLRRLTQLNARVIRNGTAMEVSSEQLVPGDLLLVEAGDIILADARVIQSAQLETDESALTGESLSVAKNNKPVPETTTLAERTCMLYKGTFVTKGNAHALVTGTGMKTELGQVAAMVQSAQQSATPLEKKINQFSQKILWLTVALIGLIFISGLIRGLGLIPMIHNSIALAVAAIPEGLPIVTTLALAQGMLRMAKRNVIIKKLAAVETLGGTNVICTDKTGTLTENKIEVSHVLLGDGWVLLKQNINKKSADVIDGDAALRDATGFQLARRVSILCNTAEVQFTEKGIKESGDPLETGLLIFAQCNGADVLTERRQFPKVDEEPFTSETKIMATLHRDGHGFFIAAKGAVEELLACCTAEFTGGNARPLQSQQRELWIRRSEELAASGERVIGIAFAQREQQEDQLTKDLVFLGLIGMLDPARADVFDALEECRVAGIDVKMITGDHPATARNIGEKLGLHNGEPDSVIHGNAMSDYEQLSAEEKQHWQKARIFARVTPKQKLDLVTVLQEQQAVVGMTGDGVNDAPALKKADIGIAMGKRGTQVAQDAADIILKDDSFSAIVVAIKSGRIIFENIRKFIMYLLSCNLSELFIISFASFLNLGYALIPLQILFINLVTDVLPALALGVTRGSDAIMKQPPRNPREPIIDRKRWIAIIVYSMVIAVCATGAVQFSHHVVHGASESSMALCNNILFVTVILSQLWNVFNMTNDTKTPLFKTDVARNSYVWYAIAICLILTFGIYFIPPVATVLALHKPGFTDLAVMLGFSLLSMIIIRILKRTHLIL
jgi:P-type Ca2+ transporter type 2C